MQNLLELRRIRKEFPGVIALGEVDFDLRAGEIHALMGENGAGKSTLIKVMTGVHQSDSGQIILNGKPVHPKSPQDAVNLGISTVYQEVNLVPNLNIAENVCLGRESRAWYGIDWAATHERARRALQRLGLDLDTRKPLGSVSIAVQQLVAIARALDVEARVLVLDEPTSSLDASETRQLFDKLVSLRDEGMGIVFITHFIDQVFEISDRTTVMRNGARISTVNTSETTKLKLVTDMIGRSGEAITQSKARTPKTTSDLPTLTTEGLAARSGLTDVTITVDKGETVGLTGLLGSGRTETLNILFGLEPHTKGQIRLEQVPRSRWNVSTAIKSGFALCPEDRKAAGIFPNLSVKANLLMAIQAKRGLWRLVGKKEGNQVVESMVESLKIKVADTGHSIKTLSGGNQQKVVLSRWLATSPKILLLDEPTRGVDVGAKFEIMSLVDRMKADGMAIIFVSSEIEETVKACDRAYVLRDRKQVGEIPFEELTEETIIAKIADDTP